MTKKDKVPLIKEEDFLGQVLDLARIYHWRVAHFRPAMTERGWRTAVSADGAGFPDSTLVRDNRLIFAELKAEGKQCTAEQYEWLLALHEVELAGKCEVYLWWPSDFYDIVEILR